MNFLDWKTKKQKKSRLQQLEEYYRNRLRIPGMVQAYAPQEAVFHGSYAQDVQLPPHLRSVRVQDTDIMVNPGQQKAVAKMIEKAIEKQIGDYLVVKQSKKTPGVYKIKGKYDNINYADIMAQQQIQYKIINGRRYRTLADMKRHAQQLLKNQQATHRKRQDQDFIRRVRLANLQKARQVLAQKRSMKSQRRNKRRNVSLW